MEHLSKLLICSLFLSIYPSFLFADQQDVCFSHSSEEGFVDKAYHYLNTKFCQPAIWFDSFFVDDRVSQDARAGSMVRWYNDFYWTEFGGFAYKSKLTARLYLPKVTRKLKLVFESDDEEDRLELFSKKDEEKQSNLGLRYDMYAKGRSSFNIKITERPSIEARYRYTYPFTVQTTGSFTQKVYQKKKVTGEITQLDIDHSLTPEFLLRWANFLKFETDTSSFEAGTGFTLYQFISQKKAISYKASIIGQEKPDHYISNTHLSVTYRQNILRKWFFYEITPEINWDKQFDSIRKKEATITLRLEVLFNNIELYKNLLK